VEGGIMNLFGRGKLTYLERAKCLSLWNHDRKE